MAIYEGKWRCVRCSSVNRGRDVNCLSCGVKRSDDVEFFLEDEVTSVSDEKLINQARAGADWICLYCGTNCLASQTQCSGCGGLRSDKNKQLSEETRGINDWTEAAQNAKELQNLAPAPPKRSLLGSRFIKLGLFGIGG